MSEDTDAVVAIAVTAEQRAWLVDRFDFHIDVSDPWLDDYTDSVLRAVYDALPDSDTP